MTESGLSGKPGLRVLAVVEKHLGPGVGRVTMDSSVLGEIFRSWPADRGGVRILVSGRMLVGYIIHKHCLGFECNANF